MFCACEGDGAWDGNEPDAWRIGDGDKLPVEDCRDNSNGMLPLPDAIGIPARSENGWPNASQSFSMSAWGEKKKEKKKKETLEVF